MPSVPRLNPGGVQQTAMPGARAKASADLSAFGGGDATAGANRAIQGLGEAAGKLYQQQRDAADDIAITDAKYKLMAEKNRLMYDPQAGAITRKGSDAFGAKDEYLPAFDKFSSDIENGLSNDRQKLALSQYKQQIRTDLDGDLMRHTFSESEKYSDETVRSALATIKDDAVLNYSNPGKVAQSIDEQRTLLIKEADRKGLPPEWVNLQLRQSTSGVHSAVIERMLDNRQYPLAKEYFEHVKGDLSGADSSSVDKALKTMRAQYEGEEHAIDLMSKYGTSATALQQAMKIEDPDVRKESVRFIKDNIDIKEMRQQEFEKANFTNAANFAEQNVERPANSVWKNLNLQQRNAIDDRIAQLRKGVQPSTDWQLYSDIQFMAANPETRQEFLKADPYMWRAKLGDTEYKEVVKLQNEGKAGNSKKLDLLGGDMQIVKSTLEENGIDTKDEKTMGQFYRKFREQQEKLQLRTGKQATDTELQQIADDILVEGIVSKNGEKQSSWMFFDKKKRVFELEDGEQLEVEQKSVPQSARKAIIDRLKAKGVPATAINDQLIYDIYLKSSGDNT